MFLLDWRLVLNLQAIVVMCKKLGGDFYVAKETDKTHSSNMTVVPRTTLNWNLDAKCHM